MQKTYYYVLLCIAFIALFLITLSKINPNKATHSAQILNDTQKKLISPHQNVVYYSIKLNSDYFLTDNYHLRVPDDTPLQGIFEIENGFPVEQTYGIIMLLDTQQLQYTTDISGQNKSFIETFTLPVKGKISVAFKTEPIKGGDHTLFIVLIRNPFEYLEENKFISPERSFIAARYKIQSNIGFDSPKYNFTVQNDYKLSLQGAGLWVTDRDIANKENQEIMFLSLWPIYNNRSDFYILYKNIYPVQSEDLVLISFINYRAIPLTIGGKDYNYLYFNYYPDTFIKIPATLEIPPLGRSIFFIMAIENPWSENVRLPVYFTNKITLLNTDSAMNK